MTARRRPPAIAVPRDRAATWRLERQLLGHDGALGQGTSPEAVARTLIGIQAQVMSAAAISTAIRLPAGSVDALPNALRARTMIRSWAMRGTLHAFDAEDFPTIVAALSTREGWRSPAWFRYFEVTEAEMEALIATIGDVLDDGRPRTRAELTADLQARLGSRAPAGLGSSWGTFLKPAAMQGLLCQAWTDGPTVAFTRPRRWLRTWRTEEPHEALVAVVRRYLAVYGPASEADILRWWGGQRPKDLRAAIDTLRPELTEVEVDGDRGLVATADLAAIEGSLPQTGGVTLLGAFDPLIVGAGVRSRLIPPAHLRRVSRTAGWISPVVLVDGVVAGIWTSERRMNRLELVVDWFEPPSRPTERAFRGAAERLAVVQGLELEVRKGPVFGSAGEAAGIEAGQAAVADGLEASRAPASPAGRA